MEFRMVLRLVIGGLIVGALTTAVVAEGPALVPWPKKIEMGAGQLTVKRISFANKALEKLAVVLQSEIQKKTGQSLPIGKGKAAKGDIALVIDPKLKGEAYTVTVNDQAVIKGGNYQAVAMGTVTVLQALDGLNLPRMTVQDEPAMAYRGFMVDVARRFHAIDTLKQCIEMCRLYKIRYLQLHLTDDQSFTFPLKKYPQINSSQQHGGSTYTLAELKDLEEFASQRGVYIVPEIEMPGHNATMLRTMPDLFKIKGTKPYEHSSTINFAKEEVVKAMEDIIGEVCAVFKSTPYFHIGADEADISLADQNEDFKKAFEKFGLKGQAQHELFRWFLNRMNETVKKHGKKTLVWEGFGRDAATKYPISKDVTVMEFESAYYLPQDIVDDGHTIINTAWTPLYTLNEHVWPAKKVYDWNPYLFGRGSSFYSTTEWFQVKPTPSIIGAQVCSWEQNEAVAVANARKILPTLSERIWNPSVIRGFEDYETRLTKTDALLDRLVHVISFKTEGLEAGNPNDYDLRAFPEKARVTITGPANATLRYTLDGSIPNAQSTVYTAPIDINHTSFVRAIALDAQGKRVGFETSDLFVLRPHATPNLATGKPVTVSGGTQNPQNPELAVDGIKQIGSAWWAEPAPQWIKIDLQKENSVDRIKVYPYWDGRRYYQYTVEVSVNGDDWTMVGDKTTNTVPSNDAGDEFKFEARKVRFVRVNMLKGSANQGVHIVEIEVFEAGK
jgi:hexosaminidase